MRPGLDELRKAHDLADPYGVPTGFVPWPGGLVHADPYGDALERGKRVGELIDKLKRPPRCPGCGAENSVLHHPGCLQKVVDDYLLMERKARAWDTLYQQVELNWEVDRMDKLLADAHQNGGFPFSRR